MHLNNSIDSLISQNHGEECILHSKFERLRPRIFHDSLPAVIARPLHLREGLPIELEMMSIN